MARGVEWSIVVADEVPPDQVVWSTRVAVLGKAVGPTTEPQVVSLGVLQHGRQEIRGADAAISGHIRDLIGPLVPGMIQVPESDDAVAVAVPQKWPPALGDLVLVDPNIQVQVRVVV